MKKILFALLAMSQLSNAQQVIPLYPANQVPNSKPAPDVIEKSETKGMERISFVTVPTLTVFQPEASKANGTAVIICPGGGYGIIAIGHEGYDVAKRFNEMGVTAFVLKYRLPSDKTMINKEIGPLQDAQQAFRIVRKRAVEFGINPDRVGVVGFSAGGHLAATTATHFEKQVGELADNSNVRPDFQILGYPVITFHDFGHKGSKENLIGKEASPEKIMEYSNEEQVTAKTPPVFLVHAADDKTVPVKNSLSYYEACVKNGVSAEMHLYPKGGHGFGLNNKTTPDKWMDRVENWMAGMGWLKK